MSSVSSLNEKAIHHKIRAVGSLNLSKTDTIVTTLNRDIDPVVNSSITLFWIRREKQWKQYIANRVKEMSLKNHQRLCPGHLNPVTCHLREYWERDCSTIHYPSLLLPKDEWPCEVESYVSDDAAYQEL